MTAITRKQPCLNHHDIEQVVKCIVDQMTEALASGERIKVRGFGSFAVRERLPTMGRNPRLMNLLLALSKRYSVRLKRDWS